jgi:hypothetical protein
LLRTALFDFLYFPLPQDTGKGDAPACCRKPYPLIIRLDQAAANTTEGPFTVAKNELCRRLTHSS